jgi:Uma2 family endonuclease
MTVAASPILHAVRSSNGAPVLLHGISWQTYETLLREIGEQHIFLTYDRGDLEIMAPSNFHERYKKVVGRLIDVLTMEIRIPMLSGGSTTFRREDLEKGLEPDECYYVQHEKQMRQKWEIDLTRDPPPDLVLEMDYTHHALDRESVYAALGVPEIWRCNGSRLECLLLAPNGSYRISTNSLAFPFLPIAQIERFMLLSTSMPETELMLAFRDWVKQNIRVS